MKKLAMFFFIVLLAVGLIGCVAQNEQTIRIIIPAGSGSEFVYSEEEISPLSSQFTMKSIDVSDRTSVVLSTVDSGKEDVSTFLTKGEPLIVYAEKGTWYKIGIGMQNHTDEDIIVVFNIENVKVRIG